MKHIFGNLKKYWYFVVLIIALLVVQAYCDLSLPDYTSNIIDVGIVNGGVNHEVPEYITGESYNKIKILETVYILSLLRQKQAAFLRSVFYCIYIARSSGRKTRVNSVPKGK